MVKFETQKEAKAYLRANFEKGCSCPTCGQTVKLYKRKLNSGMAIFLIKLANATAEGNYVHASEIVKDNKALDYSVLNFWKLVEASTEVVDGKRRSGYWHITDRGKRFVDGLTSVPSHVNLFDNKLVGFSDNQITIRDALGEKFDYEELMA